MFQSFSRCEPENVCSNVLLSLGLLCCQHPLVDCVLLLPVPFCCHCPSDACAPLLPVPFCCQYPSDACALLLPVPFCALLLSAPFFWGQCSYVISLSCQYFMLPVSRCCQCPSVACVLLLPAPFCCRYHSVANTLLLPGRLLTVPVWCQCLFVLFLLPDLPVATTFLLQVSFCCLCLSQIMLPVTFCCQYLSVTRALLLPVPFCCQ